MVMDGQGGQAWRLGGLGWGRVEGWVRRQMLEGCGPPPLPSWGWGTLLAFLDSGCGTNVFTHWAL